MSSRRASRIAQNQSVFRLVNERVTAWPERQEAPADRKLMFYCECGDQQCFERVYLTAQEYEVIRTDPMRFVVLPGHVYPEAERVVAEPDGYNVVEKYGDLRHITESMDPRRGAYP